MPSAPATSHKRSSGAGGGAGSCNEVSRFVGGGDRGTLRVEGGAEVSELISGTGWKGFGRPVLEKEGGRRRHMVEAVELDLELQGDWER